MKKKPSEKLDCVRKMPELKHFSGEGEFDITKSEVVQWLIKQPDVLQYIFTRVAANGSIPLIVYNKNKGTWKGTDR